MTPPLPPDWEVQSVFYVADSPQGIDVINRVMGKLLLSIHRSAGGVLLIFRGVADYLIMIGGLLPVLGPIQQVSEREMQVGIQGSRPVVAVSLSGAGLSVDPRVWPIWDDGHALVGQMLTGYSYEIVPTTDGSSRECALLEFSGNLILSIHYMGVDLLSRETPIKPS